MITKLNLSAKQLLLMLLASFLPFLAQAQSALASKKNEALAIGIFFVIAIGGILIYYIKWKATKREKATGDKYRIKTMEVMQNGKKIVVSKKYRIVAEQEFPKDLKRSKPAAPKPQLKSAQAKR